MHTTCAICNFAASSEKKLANHINSAHKLKSIDYTVKYLYDGVAPVCKTCSGPVRYIAFTFKKWCKEHAKDAQRETCKSVGKTKKTWNKGQTRETDERIDAQAERMSGEGNHFFGKHHTRETKDKIHVSKSIGRDEFYRRLSLRGSDFEFLTTFEQFVPPWLDVRCVLCGTVSKKTLQYLDKGSRCRKCYPSSTSIAEQQIADFVSSLGLEIRQNDRTVLSPKEIDIFVPDRNIGIEYHGLYWHASHERKPLQKNYHYEKFLAAKAAGVKLIQIYSDEWMNSRELCQSMLAQRLGKVNRHIGARECEVTMINQSDAKAFLDRCHIDGSTRAKFFVGLKKDGILVSVASFRSPFHRKHREAWKIEVARFATELNTVISGGWSKILKFILPTLSQAGYKQIITYADLRFGSGDVYSKSGFTFEKWTGPSYCYTDGQKRIDRFAVRAQPEKPEKLVAQEMGVVPLWGPGNYSFSLPIL